MYHISLTNVASLVLDGNNLNRVMSFVECTSRTICHDETSSCSEKRERKKKGHCPKIMQFHQVNVPLSFVPSGTMREAFLPPFREFCIIVGPWPSRCLNSSLLHFSFYSSTILKPDIPIFVVASSFQGTLKTC